jgi:hypothetical protein
MKTLIAKRWNPVFDIIDPDGDNSMEGIIPEFWASEFLLQLTANLTASAVVNKDYSAEFAKMGEVVNTNRPQAFKAKRKQTSDEVTIQGADLESVPVVLNQHLHVSFMIYDGEESLGMGTVRERFLKPAANAMADQMDRLVLTQAYQFLANTVGALGTDPTSTEVIMADAKMSVLKAPLTDRYLFLTPYTNAKLVDEDTFKNVDKSGSNEALLRASLGEKFNWNIHAVQNTPAVADSGGTTIGTTSAAMVKGALTAVFTADLTAAKTIGAWLTVAGEGIPHRCTGYVVGTKTATFEPAMTAAAASGVKITFHEVGAIDLTAGYKAGYVKDILVDGFTAVPEPGRMVTIGAGATANQATYGLLDTDTADSIMVDQPLSAIAANDQLVAQGPIGDYNFGFQRNAMTLAIRTPAMPIAKGAEASIKSTPGNDMAIRLVITYDGKEQGHLCTFDLLAGITVLDENLGLVLLG